MLRLLCAEKILFQKKFYSAHPYTPADPATHKPHSTPYHGAAWYNYPLSLPFTLLLYSKYV